MSGLKHHLKACSPCPEPQPTNRACGSPPSDLETTIFVMDDGRRQQVVLHPYAGQDSEENAIGGV